MGDKGVKLNFLRVRFVYICRRKARKCGGLDVEAERVTEEVQTERERVNCTPCQGHDGYNYLPNFYPANKGFIPVFVY